MKDKIKYYLIIIITGAILFIPLAGGVHLFDWDEINFAESAREMLETGDFLTVRVDYEPFHEKPPLFIWTQVLSMKIFGVNEFAARLPNAIIGIITLLLIFKIGSKLLDNKFGLIWVITYIGSFLPHFYFRTGIIDPLFNLLIFSGIYFIYSFYISSAKTGKIGFSKSLVAGAILTSLAVLTKGPVGLLLTLICWLSYWYVNRRSIKFPILIMVLYTLIAVIPYVVWYFTMLSTAGTNLIEQFIMYHIRLLTTEDAGHGGPIYYHFVVLLFGCFPASIILLRSFREYSAETQIVRNFKLWMIILLSVVLVVFSIVNTKIVHYSSLAYFPITFLSAYAMYNIIFRGLKWKKSTSWFLGIFGILFSAALILFPIMLMNIGKFLPSIKDKFTHDILTVHQNWYGFEWLPGVMMLIGVVFALIYFAKKKFLHGFLLLFGGSACTLFMFLPLMTPKIENITQATPIEFFKKMKNTGCYVEVIGYKSYAQYFYTQKPYNLSARSLNIDHSGFVDYLLTHQVGKPVFFVSKNKEENKIIQKNHLKILSKKNGFVFYQKVN